MLRTTEEEKVWGNLVKAYAKTTMQDLLDQIDAEGQLFGQARGRPRLLICSC